MRKLFIPIYSYTKYEFFQYNRTLLSACFSRSLRLKYLYKINFLLFSLSEAWIYFWMYYVTFSPGLLSFHFGWKDAGVDGQSRIFTTTSCTCGHCRIEYGILWSMLINATLVPVLFRSNISLLINITFMGKISGRRSQKNGETGWH